MDVNRKLEQLLITNEKLLKALKDLEEIQSDENYILRVFKLIDEFGVHPKLITSLIIKLQISNIDFKYSFDVLEKIGASSLSLSNDIELLTEFYYFIENVLQDTKSIKSETLIKEKKDDISKQLNEI